MSKAKVRVFKVSGRDLLVYRHGNQFIASFTWGRLREKLQNRKFKPMGDTLSGRWGAGHGL